MNENIWRTTFFLYLNREKDKESGRREKEVAPRRALKVGDERMPIGAIESVLKAESKPPIECLDTDGERDLKVRSPAFPCLLSPSLSSLPATEPSA